jgi:Dioxygenase
VHVRIAAPGFGTVTTMLFRDDDPYLEADPVFGTKRSLLARFEKHEDGDGPVEVVEHVFVPEPAGAGDRTAASWPGSNAAAAREGGRSARAPSQVLRRGCVQSWVAGWS